MGKVIKLATEKYTPEELLEDVLKDIKEFKDIVIVVINTDGTSAISHTGLSLSELAVASKMVDYEFNRIYSQEYVEE